MVQDPKGRGGVYKFQTKTNIYCEVTNRSPSPRELGYEPNKPNTINLQRVGQRTGLLVNCLTVNQGFKSVRAGQNMSLWVDYMSEE